MTDRNPYAAPELPADRPLGANAREVPPRPRIRVLAVVVGSAAGLGLFVCAIFAMIVVGMVRGDSFDPGDPATGIESVEWYMSMLPVALVCFGAGGFITGAMARAAERRHALAHVATSFALLAAIGVGAGPSHEQELVLPVWYDAALNLGFVGSIFLGAELARRRRLRRALRVA